MSSIFLIKQRKSLHESKDFLCFINF